MISIGVHHGGPEQHGSPIYQLFSVVGRAIAKVRGPWVGSDDFGPCDSPPTSGPFFEEGTSPAVNVVFYVPGSILDHRDLKKIEAARYSRKKKLVLVAVPVPKEEVESGGSIDFVIDALHKANAIAAEIFSHKGAEQFDLEKADAIVEHLRQALTSEHGAIE